MLYWCKCFDLLFTIHISSALFKYFYFRSFSMCISQDKTFGKIIHRHGGLLILYRGRHYKPSKRPVIPLMLWKPQEPVYPRLVKTTIEELSIQETKAMRKRGLSVPALTRLGKISRQSYVTCSSLISFWQESSVAAKNGYYGSLVPMVRDAFLSDELVRIDCKGLPRSDYKKIGCKLRVMLAYWSKFEMLTEWYLIIHLLPS